MVHYGSEHTALRTGRPLRFSLFLLELGAQFVCKSEEEASECSRTTGGPISRHAVAINPSAISSSSALEVAPNRQVYAVIAPHWQVKVIACSTVVLLPDLSEQVPHVTEADTS